jgi:hypothetical protein
MKKIAIILSLISISNTFSQISFQKNVIIDKTFGSSNPQKVESGDINGDNFPDILIGGYSIAWYRNLDGLGNFSKPNFINNGFYECTYVNIVKLDNDNYPDVIYGIKNGSDNYIYWQKNLDGLGNFGTPILIYSNSNNILNINIEIVDFDNDNDKDLVLYDATLRVLKNNNGIFTNSTIPTPGFRYHMVDVNGDNLLDVIAVEATSSNSLKCFIQNTNGTFTLTDTIETYTTGVDKIYSQDIDEDGKIDIVINIENGSTRRIEWYRNIDGLGSFTNRQTLISLPSFPNGSNGNFTTLLKFVDLDNNNKKDLVLMESTNHKISWFKKLANNTFSTEQIITSNTLTQLAEINHQNQQIL